MTTTLAPDIAAFAAAVRAELADLAPDEIDDLTDGLEADLAERQNDAPDEAFGDPTEYAAELRAAAGHPPRSASAHLGARRPRDHVAEFRAELVEHWANWSRFLETRPLLQSAVAFVTSLRPVWWVFRGVVLGMLVQTLFVSGFALPTSPGWWLVLAAAVVVSVQFGRGRWLPYAWMRGALLAGNVLLAISAPFIVLAAASSWSTVYTQAMYPPTPYYSDGLTYNGATVGNIFAYDAEGNPVEQVQLFDQNGDPLNFAGDPTLPWTIGPHDTPVVPSDDVPGRSGWNVYPLGELAGDPFDPTDLADPTTPEFPFVVVKPLSGFETTTAEPEE